MTQLTIRTNNPMGESRFHFEGDSVVLIEKL